MRDDEICRTVIFNRKISLVHFVISRFSVSAVKFQKCFFRIVREAYSWIIFL